jgi:antirestriction protein ArdC
VFNIDQVEGVEPPPKENVNQIDFSPSESAEEIITSYKGMPEITSEEQRAYYLPKQDQINMPLKSSFQSVAFYYSILFHEMIHSTGHQKRLARPGILTNNKFGDSVYSMEELIAEMGACFLVSKTNLSSETLFDNSAAYIQGWIKKLKSDPQFIIRASSQAMQAVNYILGGGKQNDQ